MEEKVCFEITNTADKEHLENLVKVREKKKIISLRGTSNESGQGLGIQLVEQIGQFSGVDWKLTWVVNEEDVLRVTHVVTVPRRLQQTEMNHKKSAA